MSGDGVTEENAGQQETHDTQNTQKTHTPQAIYHDSSQYRHWRFSAEELQEKRAAANGKAVAVTRAGWDEEKGLNPESSLSTSITPPSVQEEDDLIVYYLSQIRPICNLFQFPENVEATAMTYMKRVYLANSVVDLHPKRVM